MWLYVIKFGINRGFISSRRLIYHDLDPVLGLLVKLAHFVLLLWQSFGPLCWSCDSFSGRPAAELAC